MLKDWQSAELIDIVESVSDKDSTYQRHQMKKLVELIDQNWDMSYKTEKLEAHIFSFETREYLEASDASSFSKFLVHRAWLPSTVSSDSDSQVLCKGSSLFNSYSSKIKKYLHSHVPCIDAKVQSADFLKHLKIQDDISRMDLLKHLVQWSESSRDAADGFCTSINHMYSVYNYLIDFSSTDEDNEIIEAFTEESSSLIFVPSKYEDVLTDADVVGHFLSIRDVCWMDPTTVLYAKQKYNHTLPSYLPRVLSLYYSKNEHMKLQMQEVFNNIRIPRTPLIKTLIAMIKYNSSLTPSPGLDQVKDFTSIILYLVEANSKQGLDENYIISNLKDSKSFPSHRKVWVTLNDCLLENDDQKLANAFSKNEKVHFLQWPAKRELTKSYQHRENDKHISERKEKEMFSKDVLKFLCSNLQFVHYWIHKVLLSLLMI